MYVCVCRAVTEKHIETAVHGGARRLRDLREQLGVTEECGRCAKCAKQCLDDAIGQVCPNASSSAQSPAYILLKKAA